MSAYTKKLIKILSCRSSRKVTNEWLAYKEVKAVGNRKTNQHPIKGGPGSRTLPPSSAPTDARTFPFERTSIKIDTTIELVQETKSRSQI